MANQPPGLNGINVLGYMGVNPTTPSNYKTYNRAPTTNDSMNFKIGDHWEWQDPQRLWVLVALIGGEATWKEIVFDAANEFPTNAGIAFPLAGVLNVLGDTTSVLTSGAGNTITIVTGPEVATKYVADDANIAVPAFGELAILGGPNINTSVPVPNGPTLNVNLNTSILQPFTTVDASEGMYSLGVTNLTDDRFMYAFPDTSTFLGRQSGNLAATPTDAIANTGIGALSLTAVTTGSRNSGVGNRSLQSTTTGTGNVAIGDSALRFSVTSGFNVAVGTESQTALTGGNGRNVSVGGSSLDALVGGEFNIAIGDSAGSDYTTNESSNIVIGNSGVIAESNVIRIGVDGAGDGEQNACYVAGIYNGTLGATNKVTFIDDQGKLAGSTGTDGQVIIGATGASPAWMNITSLDDSIAVTNGPNSIDLSTAGGGGIPAEPFFYYLNATVNNATGGGGGYLLGTGTALTLVYDVGGNVNPGGGGPAIFVAPATGYYSMTFYARLIFAAAYPTVQALFQLVSNPTVHWRVWLTNSGVNATELGILQTTIGGTSTFFLNAGDGIQFFVEVGTGANTVGIQGGVGAFDTFVTGYRIA